MTDFDKLREAIRGRSREEKQQIFQDIRDSVLIHELENIFGVRAEVILEAISQASDLTQRGIRGLVAELTFVMDVAPTVDGWTTEPLIGNLSYDACLVRGDNRIRIQVKTQRRERGLPKLRYGSYCVEVQRTRTGDRDGVATRPYRFDEFDLLAVCMWTSTGNWQDFMYVPVRHLEAARNSNNNIATFQSVPTFPGEGEEVWTSNLRTALDRTLVLNARLRP